MANRKQSKSQNWGTVNPTVGTQTQRVSTPLEMLLVEAQGDRIYYVYPRVIQDQPVTVFKGSQNEEKM